MSQPTSDETIDPGVLDPTLPLPIPLYIHLPHDLSCLEGLSTPLPDPNTFIDPLPIQPTSHQAITTSVSSTTPLHLEQKLVEEVAMCHTTFQNREIAVTDGSTDPEMDGVIPDREDESAEQRDISKELHDITNDYSPLPLECLPHSLDVNQGMSLPTSDETIDPGVFDPTLPLPIPLYIHLPPDFSCLEGLSTSLPDPNTLIDPLPIQPTSQQTITTSVSSTTPLHLEQKLVEEVAACQTHFRKETTVHDVNSGNSLEDKKMHMMKDKKQLAKERKRVTDKAFAVCYRKRKKKEKSETEKRCEELMAMNVQLKLQVCSLTSEIAHLKSCWEKTKVPKRKKTCSFIFFSSKKNFSGTCPQPY